MLKPDQLPSTLTWCARWLILLVVTTGCAVGASQAGPSEPPSQAADSQSVASAAVEPDPTSTPAETASDGAQPPPVDSPPDSAMSSGDQSVGSEQREEQSGPRAVLLDPARVGTAALVEPDDRVRPVSLSIDDIGIEGAGVIPVGVNPDETLEVPPADEVGWYRFGPVPGDAGSAVLAAHIAFDGVDGVFRHLADVAIGSVVTIEFDDGTAERYRIESIDEYAKDALPLELFGRDGAPRLALITCGGGFNPQLRAYDSNTVAVAVPVSGAS